MKFSRLRLSGFKSFVDPTELHIEPGLTGVVGPNGCGKSNLLEALRWVMGENRPTSMRGVGHGRRDFRRHGLASDAQHAEVTLVVDNSDRSAPVAVQRNRDDRDHAAHRARGGIALPHQRPRGTPARRADFLRRRVDRFELARARPPRTDQHPDQPEAAGAPRDPGRGRRHFRPPSAPARSRAAAEGGGDQSGAAERRHRGGRHAAPGLATAGAAGLALSQSFGIDPQGRGDVVPAALARSRRGCTERRRPRSRRRPRRLPTARRARPRPRPNRPRRRRHCRRCATRKRRSPQRCSGCCTNATVSMPRKRAPAKRRSASGSASDRRSRISPRSRAGAGCGLVARRSRTRVRGADTAPISAHRKRSRAPSSACRR